MSEPVDCVYVRQQIAAGLSDVAAGRVIDHEELFAELLEGFPHANKDSESAEHASDCADED